mmetsp:Transcript_33288/g.58689  ORF Transcript_33288/g.58689 Transcript_33288/m.58689 type:complete len:215 (+) Transcript_33288:426-1070(+)
MACTHWHNAPAAEDTFITSLGVKLGSFVYFSILRRVELVIASLSKFLILCRKFTSFNSVLACAQDGVFSMTVITAHIVFMTISGGFAYAFTSEIDFLSSFSRASSAASSAGMAFSRSRVASSARIFVSFASFSMRTESASTAACCASALLRSCTMTCSSSSHSFAFFTQTSCLTSRSSLMTATCVLASSSLLRPLRSLSADKPISFCFSLNKVM